MNAFLSFWPWHRCLAAGFGLGVLAGLAAAPAQATERQASDIIEAGVLDGGQTQSQTWSTRRSGRDAIYNPDDERIEFPIDLADGLQTAMYLNFGGLTRDLEVGGERVPSTTSEFHGLSSAWTLQLADPTTDALGSALCLELTGGPAEAGIAANILIDKRIGNVSASLNVIGGLHWAFAGGEALAETALETEVGLGYLIAPKFTIGLEVHTQTGVVAGAAEPTVLFGGPAVSCTQDGWWFAATYLPQIGHFGGAHAHGPGPQQTSNLALTENEQVEGRLLFGVNL